MSAAISPTSPPKESLSLRLPISVALALAIALTLQFVQLCRGLRGDFPNHWEFGRRMAVGEMIYANGLNVVYPPLWSLMHAPLTILPPHAAQFAVFPLFASLGLLVWVLRRLTQKHFAVTNNTFWFAIAAGVLLAGRFLFRDMVECGVNLALVALAWLAIYCWAKRRIWLGGMCLGLAVSLKCTPIAFLGYFLWKREWKMAAATTLATVAFTLSPVLWMGPARYAEAMSLWFSYARRGLTEQSATAGVLGHETVQNLSLRPALAALPMAGASPVAAGLAIKAALAALALTVAWLFRRRIGDRTSPVVLWECAIISLAMLLYSPITWTQHCVGILPAMVLLMLSAQVPGRVPRCCWGVVAAFVVAILVLNRGVLGREWSLVLLGLHVHAWSLVGLLFVALACCQRAAASCSENALANFAKAVYSPPAIASEPLADPVALLALPTNHRLRKQS